MRSTSSTGVADVDRRQPCARHHQLARGAQPKPQRTMQAHLLFGLEQSAVAALRDQQLDLFGRVDVPMAGRRDAQQPQQQRAAAVQDVDRPREQPQRPLHRAARSRCAVRVGFCSASDFGTSSPTIIASTVRTSRTMTAAVDCGGVGLQAEHRLRAAAPARGASARLTVGAEDQAGQRDADLRDRDVAVELVRDPRRPAGSARPGDCRLPRAGASRLRRAPTAANSAATYSAVSRISSRMTSEATSIGTGIVSQPIRLSPNARSA